MSKRQGFKKTPIVVAMWAAWALDASAQTEAAPIDKAKAEKAPTEVHAIVVTGEKLPRRLSEALSSVVVNTARDLQEHGDSSLNDVLARTPGVYANAGNEHWGIRGVPVSGFDDQGPATLNGAVSV